MATGIENSLMMRRRIIEVARQLFQQQGYDHTTLGDITKELGASDITSHFTSKDDLLEAVWSEP